MPSDLPIDSTASSPDNAAVSSSSAASDQISTQTGQHDLRLGDRPFLAEHELLVDLDLAPPQIELVQQKITLDERRLQLKLQMAQFQANEHDAAWVRKSRWVQQLAQGLAGLAVLGAGISFTMVDHMMGPYLMGFGTAATSFSLTRGGEANRLSSTPSHDDPQDKSV